MPGQRNQERQHTRQPGCRCSIEIESEEVKRDDQKHSDNHRCGLCGGLPGDGTVSTPQAMNRRDGQGIRGMIDGPSHGLAPRSLLDRLGLGHVTQAVREHDLGARGQPDQQDRDG